MSSSSSNHSNSPTSNGNGQQKQQQNQQNGNALATTTTGSNFNANTSANATLPGPGPAVVIQSTSIISSANNANIANANANARNPTFNRINNLPPLSKQLVMTKLQTIHRILAQNSTGYAGQGQINVLTPYCDSVSAPAFLSSILKPEAICPSPPGWDSSLKEALESTSTTPYIQIPIDKNSEEYSVLSSLVSSVPNVTNIERVVNAQLWKRFVATRRDILSTKSNDLELLRNLKLDDMDVERENLAKKFKIDPSVAAVEYSDNVALLFHGTRHSLQEILEQGLDERLSGSAGTGLLGKGIYFSDDPLKSMFYDRHGVILIFAVLLGDCMQVDHLPCKETFVREPKKATHQMRNHSDTFFDSIAGRPNPKNPANEFVIYNRNQCCPLYAVTYTRPPPGGQVQQQQTNRNSSSSAYLNTLPSFVWTPKKNDANIPNSNSNDSQSWPYFAKTIFELMEKKRKDKEIAKENLLTDIAIKLSLIFELGIPGYTDNKINLDLLKKFNFDLEKTIDHILQQVPTSLSKEDDDIEIVYSSIQISAPSTSNRSGQAGPGQGQEQGQSRILCKIRRTGDSWKCEPLDGSTTPIRTPMNEDCLICYSEFPPNPINWVVLKCQHKICKACHGKMSHRGVTMSGVEHVSIKCPFCQTADGIEIGTCPNGVMKIVRGPPGHHCVGYEQYGVIGIGYNINEGKYQTKRGAFLPDSPEGNKVLELLKVAWDRRLCFSIGTSATTGESDTVVWRIHHKTNLTGGSATHGYPDPTYLQRVTEELKQVGIE